MRAEMIKFNIKVYDHAGGFSGFMTTDEEAGIKGPVAVLQPERKIDPLGVYQFAVDAFGNSISVRKRALTLNSKKPIQLVFERKPFMTAMQEKSAMLEATRQYMKETWIFKIVP